MIYYLFVKMKVFNYSELHFAELTSFKIRTLVAHRIIFFQYIYYLPRGLLSSNRDYYFSKGLLSSSDNYILSSLNLIVGPQTSYYFFVLIYSFFSQYPHMGLRRLDFTSKCIWKRIKNAMLLDAKIVTE